MTNVLVVDDDDGLREAMEAVLALEGFNVELAADGREALQLLSGPKRPDAMLVDLMMPVMNGWELLDVLKSDPELAHIPVAVISAVRTQGNLPGSVVVLPKPCDLGDVLEFLDAATAAGTS
jgi:CheY-like chemotaxis protein